MIDRNCYECRPWDGKILKIVNFLDYSINFLTIVKTEGKPCSIRVQITGFEMVSERDFDNVN